MDTSAASWQTSGEGGHKTAEGDGRRSVLSGRLGLLPERMQCSKARWSVRAVVGRYTVRRGRSET